MKNILTFSLATAALLVSSVQAQAFTLGIDDFNDGELKMEVGPNADEQTKSNSQNSLSGVEGGERDILLQWLDGFGHGVVDLDESFIGLEVGTNYFALSNDAAASLEDLAINSSDGVSSVATLTYNGMGFGDEAIGLGGGLGIDISAGEQFALDILFLEKDDFFDIEIGVMDVEGNNSSVLKTNLLPSPLTIGLDEFSGVDMTAITEISLAVRGFNSEDAVIDNFRVENENEEVTTPEPAAVLGLMLTLGFGAFSKKKKQA